MPEKGSCPGWKSNEERCTCPNTSCDKHGVCCACVVNHQNLGNLPRCLRENPAN